MVNQRTWRQTYSIAGPKVPFLRVSVPNRLTAPATATATASQCQSKGQTVSTTLSDAELMLILRRFGSFFGSLKRVHANIFMLACALFNQQNKELILLSIIT